ncbi:MAG TPA: electron transfer flavoprotein subunit beta/FixA family protein [Gemmatimonadaceae bacterium]|nr:electron transfer flavoprotein subunit beta/FixA family protein [Gemmatimonadaceae bacterium]
MKIAVCIKRVPDMEQRFKIAGNGATVDETGLKYTMSDFDEWAVEAALQLNEKHGGGEITVISLGPDAVQETIRKALAMGADRGVQLKTDSVPFDGLAIARALAAELQGGGYDLVLFGKVAVDTSSGVTGAMTAELLGLPCVSSVSKLDIENGRGRAERVLEGAIEVVEFPLPAVVTVDQGLVVQARYPALKGIMAAKKKPLEVKPAQLGDAAVSVTKMELPQERAPGRIIGEGAAAVPELVRLLREEARVL